MPQSVDRIFFEREELEKDFQSFLEDKEVKYLTILESVFNSVKNLLRNNRFIPMDKEYCYDRNMNGCWLGLCENNFKYMDSVVSGRDYQVILKTLKNFYKNNHIDIPTKEELLSLTGLNNNLPFTISNKRPNNPSCYIFYKKETKVQAFDLDGSYLRDTDNDAYIHPIYRLYNTSIKNLSEKKHFLLWVANGLKPKRVGSKDYNILLELDIKIDTDFNIINFSNLFMNLENVIAKFLKADNIRANLIEYDKKLILDVNKGSWEVFNSLKKENFINPVEIKLEKSIVAKNPQESIVRGGVIGIDFGTKSTVVVYQKDNEVVLPIRVGIGDWSKKNEPFHYENPTVMEFINLNNFLSLYDESVFRPKTKWDDLTISHTAYENLKNSASDKFNAYLTELKQWAGDKNRKLKIEDFKGQIYELKEFENLTEDDLNPIELYAYYLGLYINNQHYDNIYLEYLLSFPITYNLETRKKILDSFKKGLSKALPDIGDEINNLKVSAGVSEPAAYASIALQEYNLAEENEKNFYGIFDFGGGTTDFDFGIFRWADEEKNEESRYDYVIEHFGAGGDKYLGGENLLELLAFEIFKKNSDILREKNCSFRQPPESKEFLGSELLLSDSRESKLNMVNLIKKLRFFWERENFENTVFDDGLKIDLYDNNGEKIAQVELEVDESELLSILQKRIKKGVDSFFESLIKAFDSYHNEVNLDIDTINIFLAGNSSKSPIVKQLFENKKSEFESELEKEDINASIKIFEPLNNKDDFSKPNGKTGVAFGLIETRPGGVILVIDKNIKDDDIKFSYYLGRNRRRKFRVSIDRDYSYNEWYKFINASDDFEIYYTASPLAITNNLPIRDNSIKKLRISIPNKDANKNIYIRLISSDGFEYGIGVDKDNIEVIKKIRI